MSNSSAYHVIQPSGMLSSSNLQQLTQEITDCIAAKIMIVLVDLQDVVFLDSAGLGLLVSLHTKMRLAGGKLYICSPKEQAQGILDLSDLDRIIQIFPTRTEFEWAVIRLSQA